MKAHLLAVFFLLLAAASSSAEPAPARSSPFDELFIHVDGRIDVRVGDVAGRLVRVDQVEADDLVAGAKRHFGPRWKKRIAEDLGDTIEAIRDERPESDVEVVVSVVGQDEPVTVQATFTQDKRAAIYRSVYAAPPMIDRRVADAILSMTAAAMETGWSYRHTRPDLDVASLLQEHLAEAAGKQRAVSGEDLQQAISNVIAQFPDGHASVRYSGTSNKRLRLPVMFVLIENGKIAVLRDGDDGNAEPLDPQRPFVSHLDGRPVADWLDAARKTDTLARHADWHAAELLRFPNELRRVMGVEPADQVTLTLAGEGIDTDDLKLPLSTNGPAGRPRGWLTPNGVEPLVEMPVGKAEDQDFKSFRVFLEKRRAAEAGAAGRLDDIAYLSLREMASDDEILTGVADAMEQFRNAEGLVIDVRGNGGGSRLPLLLLWRYLNDPDETPRVVTAAKPLLAADGTILADLGGSRFMFAADAGHWSEAEQKAIDEFSAEFAPQWDPGDAFAVWHYLILGGDLNATATTFAEPYHFDKPVVILMDGDCFSATSIFLAAMATRDDVTLLGTPAASGSGRVQSTDINDDFRLRLSTMASFMPDGRLFDGNVIEPDVEVWPTLTDVTGESDTQLEAAIELLNR